VADGSLDFVYVDASHTFDNCNDRSHYLVDQRCARGHRVGTTTFFCFYQSGVVQAVFAYTAAHRIVNWYLTGEQAMQATSWVKPLTTFHWYGSAGVRRARYVGRRWPRTMRR